MAYSRFGWDGSDVYVYLDVGGFLYCCGCPKNTDGIGYRAYKTQNMVNHLLEHRKDGDEIPARVIERLWEDHEENMQFIRETAFEEMRKLVEENGLS